MKISPKSVDSFPDSRERYSDKILKLIGDGSQKADILMLEFSKGLMGSSGKFVTPSAYFEFKANGKLSKLKNQKAFRCKETSELEINSGPGWSRWKYISDKSNFVIEFSNYAGNRFTIQKDYIEASAEILWNVLGKTLSGSVISANGLGDPGFHKKQLADSLKQFVEADVLVYDTVGSISQPNPYIHWSRVQAAMGMLVAGTAVSGESKVDEFRDIFKWLNSMWADLLNRFVQELERQGDHLKSSRRAVESTGDMFERFSAIWYLRTILLLCFGKKHTKDEDRIPWKVSLLMPRALDMAGRQLPELSPFPKLDAMRDEVNRHRG